MTRLTDTDRAILARYPASTRVAMRHAAQRDADRMASHVQRSADGQRPALNVLGGGAVPDEYGFRGVLPGFVVPQ